MDHFSCQIGRCECQLWCPNCSQPHQLSLMSGYTIFCSFTTFSHSNEAVTWRGGAGLSAGLPDWGHWYTGGDTTHHCTALDGQGGVGGGVCDLLTSDPTSSPCSSPRTGSKQRCWAGLGWAGARSMRDDERNAAAGVKLPGPGPRRAVGSPIARTICRL